MAVRSEGDENSGADFEELSISFSFLKISLMDRVCSLGSTLVQAVSLIGH
jgi:hypothetical protein